MWELRILYYFNVKKLYMCINIIEMKKKNTISNKETTNYRMQLIVSILVLRM